MLEEKVMGIKYIYLIKGGSVYLIMVLLQTIPTYEV